MALSVASVSGATEPLRVFLRGGPKTHGPAGNGLHDHERWLTDWKKLLEERGAKVDGAMRFPTAEQFEDTDVLVMFAAEAGSIAKGDRENLDQFLKRGGGIVCFHDAVCGTNAQWFKTIVGGAWEHGRSKWFEGEISFYYLNQDHPITEGASNFDIDDEVYWDLHMMPEAKILAASWQPDPRNTRQNRPHPHIYNVVPQMWTYEKKLGTETYRAFVSLLGHKYSSFEKPHVRSVLLRGIAWAGQRNVNLLCDRDELATLRYPEGGPTAPEKAANTLEVHPDFAVSLVAGEPLMNKPISLDWDAAGRLWVAETPEYPNGRRGIRSEQKDEAWKDHGGLVSEAGVQQRAPRDRISILTDIDDDGRMDKKIVWYEGLELVTGFVFFRDGVIAAAAPDIWLIRDVNNDEKADRVEKLYTGLGTFDTHAVINNLRWGFDGWVYATHGYSSGDVKSADGSKSFGRINSGVVRFKPDGSAFEQYCSKGGNTWGLDVAWDNEVFFTQPTSGDLLNHVVLPEYVLARGKLGATASFKPVIRGRKSYPLIKSENLAYVQIDLVGSFTASAGCAIYGGGTWPEEWNYSYFTTEPTINILHHEAVKPAGVTFTADKTREPEFVGGRDLWFRPIETRIGPDGALYVLDFYNQAVIHNDTRGPRHNAVNAAVRPDRDHYFGRIWRFEHKQARKVAVPDLSRANPSELIKALEHSNLHVRHTAERLLSESADDLTLDSLARIAVDEAKPAPARIHALWVLYKQQRVNPGVVMAAGKSKESAVRRNALRVAAAARPGPEANTLKQAMLQRLQDTDPRTRLAAINALSAFEFDQQTAQALLDLFPKADDQWTRSAIVSVASRDPVQCINVALLRPEPEAYRELVAQLTEQVAAGASGTPDALVVLSAARPPAADALKVAIYETLARNQKSDFAPVWRPELLRAFQQIFASADLALPAAALPLAARWDKSGALSAEIKSVVEQLIARLNDAQQSDEVRGQVAASLLGVRQTNPEILRKVAKLIGAATSTPLQRRIIEALGATGDPAVGKLLTATWAEIAPGLHETAFAQVIKRADWALAMVEALKSGQIALSVLGPANVYRLRTHSDLKVARRAAEVIENLRGPEVKEKQALVAKLEPSISKSGGDAQKGKELFTQNCAVCHKFNGDGRDAGPDLTGMGAHGVHELLVHMLDPNRFVEENFIAVSVETKDDQSFDGIVARENRAAVVLRNNSGEIEIKTEDIKSRRSTGRSLMPEGFEALGADGLRDILVYLGASESKFRVIDLKPVFTASSLRGIYNSAEALDETLKFRKFGLVTVEGVPFEIVSPGKTLAGNNILVLKGGNGLAKTMPQKTEVAVGVKASRLHFLGGVGGWAWPCCGGEGNKGLPVAKITVSYADGEEDNFVLTNGVDVVDYIGNGDVPGSKLVPGLLSRGQVRYFSRPVRAGREIQKIALQSFDNSVAPTFVAITADASNDATKLTQTASLATDYVAPSAAKGRPFKWGDGLRVLMTGGGSSHDFARWFGKADSEILSHGGKVSANYTEDMDRIAAGVKEADVLYISHNKPIPDPAARQGIFDHVAAGKGVLLVHAGLWYNWSDWPEYNRDLCGGGSRGHDRYGEFEVKLSDRKHPVTDGLPERFTIADELYWFKPDPSGLPIDVLATAYSEQKKETYPMIFVVKHPKARIVAITLGHDGKAHDHPAYKRLLQNALHWVAAKP
jgi:putative membrane-bound dehydrogenase-like protein